MRRVHNEDAAVHRRSSGLHAVIVEFVGPLVVLLGAVGIEWKRALLSGLAVVAIMTIGASLLVALQIENVSSSPVGILVIGGTVALAIIAGLTQAMRGLMPYGLASLSAFLVASSGLLSSSHRSSLVAILCRDTERPKSRPQVLWIAVLSILGVSDWSFAALAFLIACATWLLTLKRDSIDSRHRDTIALWVCFISFWLLSNRLGWRESPWAFALGSLDNHIWVAGSWAINRFGWFTDPTTSGIEIPYHFLGQAIAGQFSQVVGLDDVASVGILVPSLIIATVFFSFRTVLGVWSADENPWLALLAILAVFSPLEPNSPLSTESFTHLVSVGYLSVLLTLLCHDASRTPKRRRTYALVVLVVIIGSAKVFTGMVAVGIVFAVAGSVYFLGSRSDALALALKAFLSLASLVVFYYFIYATKSTSAMWSIRFGFGSLEKRFGLVGGVFVGPIVSALLLVALFWPFWFGLYWIVRESISVYRNRSRQENGESVGFLIAAVGLNAASLLLDFPPAGYPERYFSSVGLILAMLAGLSFATRDLRESARHHAKISAKWKYLVAIFMMLGIWSTSDLWAQRLQGWPSSRRFLMVYASPILLVSAILLAIAWGSRVSERRYRAHPLYSMKALTACFFLAFAIFGAGVNVGYAIRGPLITLHGVINGSVSGTDFVAELKESGDRRRQFESMLRGVSAVTPASAILASNAGTEAQLFIVSEAQRRLWWSSYLGDIPRADSRLTEHLRWRQEMIREFAAKPSEVTAIAMRSCGVTHFLLEVGSSRSSSSIRFDQGFVREYAFDEYLLLELLVEPDPSSLPKESWKQWCAAGASG
jgi:hypothetical protein